MFICKIKKQDSLAKRAKLLTSGITHLGGPARHSYKHFINIIKEINRKKTIAGLSRLGGLSHFARPAILLFALVLSHDHSRPVHGNSQKFNNQKSQIIGFQSINNNLVIQKLLKFFKNLLNWQIYHYLKLNKFWKIVVTIFS